MRKPFEEYRWRRRYNYVCDNCRKKRTTLEYDRMLKKQCTVCKDREDKAEQENQPNLFNL